MLREKRERGTEKRDRNRIVRYKERKNTKREHKVGRERGRIRIRIWEI